MKIEQHQQNNSPSQFSPPEYPSFIQQHANIYKFCRYLEGLVFPLTMHGPLTIRDFLLEIWMGAYGVQTKASCQLYKK